MLGRRVGAGPTARRQLTGHLRQRLHRGGRLAGTRRPTRGSRSHIFSRRGAGPPCRTDSIQRLWERLRAWAMTRRAVRSTSSAGSLGRRHHRRLGGEASQAALRAGLLGLASSFAPLPGEGTSVATVGFTLSESRPVRCFAGVQGSSSAAAEDDWPPGGTILAVGADGWVLGAIGLARQGAVSRSRRRSPASSRVTMPPSPPSFRGRGAVVDRPLQDVELVERRPAGQRRVAGAAVEERLHLGALRAPVGA
ncbi:hypothetical protein SAMN05661080_02329 [Modestobacter sp. DSM 44400]|nr:hypothetical protein SAMN05661080_02329 [Modestobacter sp. DSM 44400]